MERTIEAQLEELRKRIERNEQCPLAATSPRVVFGEGNPRSPFIIVGEGPGEREELEGRPFVGRAGQLLDKLLDSVGVRRDELWITNVLKRRASKLVDGRVKNRLPRADELAVHKEYLDSELKIVVPRLILCLGNLAANTLIHRSFRMTQEHGRWFSGPAGKRLMATYHPAYILRLEGSDYDEVVRQATEDFDAIVKDFRALQPPPIDRRPAAGGHRPPAAEDEQRAIDRHPSALNGQQQTKGSRASPPRDAASGISLG